MDLLAFLGRERISQIANLVSEHSRGKYGNIWQRHLLFEKASAQRRLGTGYGRIAGNLGVSKGQVVNWLVGRYEPLRRHVVPIVGPHLAYVLGAWLGDGGLSLDRKRWRHYTKLSVKDVEFAYAFSNSLATCLNREKAAPIIRTNDGRLTAYANNRILYDFLKSCRLKLELAEPIAIRYPGSFLRGFWDAEGTIDVTTSQYKVQAFNTDERVVKLAVRTLDELGIHFTVYPRTRSEAFLHPRTGRIYHRRHRVYYTIHIRSCCHRKFAKTVGLTIERKRVRLRMIVAAERPKLKYCF